jgi:hypothetical protein
MNQYEAIATGGSGSRSVMTLVSMFLPHLGFPRGFRNRLKFTGEAIQMSTMIP